VVRNMCVHKYALKTCKQQSALEESAVKQKSVAPFVCGGWGVGGGKTFFTSTTFPQALRNTWHLTCPCASTGPSCTVLLSKTSEGSSASRPLLLVVVRLEGGGAVVVCS